MSSIALWDRKVPRARFSSREHQTQYWNERGQSVEILPKLTGPNCAKSSHHCGVITETHLRRELVTLGFPRTLSRAQGKFHQPVNIDTNVKGGPSTMATGLRIM